MGSTTLTPNIGFQVPGFDQSNWQVPTNFNWSRLDRIFGGEIQIPSLKVTDLVVTNFDILNLASALASSCTQEVADGAKPGQVFTLSRAPILMMGFYYNGGFQIPGVNYTILGNTITTNFTVLAGDTLYAVYF